MTPFEVYVLMTVDKIIGACLALTLCGLSTIVSVALIQYTEQGAFTLSKIWRWVCALTLFFALAFVLLPSRSTLIAMKVVPALTSEKAFSEYAKLGEEAKQCLVLFKDWAKKETENR